MNLGVIVSSSSHVDYVCQIYGDGETADPPRPTDHAFGAFCGIEDRDGGLLVGLIYDTRLLNPEFGSLGPRLSSEDQLAVFSPDYLAERATLVGILVVGQLGRAGAVQRVPRVAAQVDAVVRVLTPAEVLAFHTVDGGLGLRYLPWLASLDHPLAQQLVLQVLDDLAPLFPGAAAQLAVVRRDLLWKAHIAPLG